MTTFIKTSTGSFVAVSAIEFAEIYDDGLMQIATPRGRFLVSRTDFNIVAGISTTKKRAKVTNE